MELLCLVLLRHILAIRNILELRCVLGQLYELHVLLLLLPHLVHPTSLLAVLLGVDVLFKVACGEVGKAHTQLFDVLAPLRHLAPRRDVDDSDDVLQAAGNLAHIDFLHEGDAVRLICLDSASGKRGG